MNKEALIYTSIILFAISIVTLIFTYFFFHFINEKGRFSKVFFKKPNKPFISGMFGGLGVILFANALTLLLLGLFS